LTLCRYAGLTYLVLSLLLLQHLSVLVYPQVSEFPPLVVRKSIAWLDDSGLWISDISLYSSMPWYIGGLGYIRLVATLNTAPPEKDLNLIIRIITSDGNELASKFIGSLSQTKPIIRDEIQFVVSSFYFSTNDGVTGRNDLRVVVEGYIDGRRHEALIDLPVLVSMKTARLSINVFINDNPDYNFIFESITRVNITALIRNTRVGSISSLVVTFYVNETVVDRVTIDRLGGLESKNVSTSVFKYFTPGVYYVKVSVVYYLLEGVQEEVSAVGILEVCRRFTITLSVDKSVVMEGTQVFFIGTITPSIVTQVVLERFVSGLWITTNVATSNDSGMFMIPWTAENVLPGYEYMTHIFRVRIPISLIGGNATVYSPIVRVNVFSSERVVDLIADISLDITPDTVLRGSKTTISVKLRPTLPLCIPVKIVYRDSTLYEWVEMSEVVVCDGEGVSSIDVKLSPSRYLVKAMVISKLRRVESLPKAFTVMEIPKLLLDIKKTIFYGEPLEIKVRLYPQLGSVIEGILYISYNNSQYISKTFSIVDGEASIILRDLPGSGVMNITVCASVYSITVCNTTMVEVIKPSMSISPTSTTVEVGSSVTYSIAVSPSQRYSIRLSVLQDSSIVSSQSVETDDSGIARLSIKAPSRAGKYTVLAEIPDSGVSANAVLNVIEIVRTIRLELLNKSVGPLGKVMARVTLYPTPTTPSQLVLLIQVGGNWTPAVFDLITSDSKVITFTAPEREGTYQVKAQLSGTQVESNTELLIVSSPIILRQEYLYGALAASVAIAVLLFLRGRRRR